MKYILIIILTLSISFCTEQLNFTDYDKEIIITSDKLKKEFSLTQSKEPKSNTFKKSKYFDGSFELEYEYESNDDEDEDFLYIYQLISIEKNITDAILVYNAENIGLKLVIPFIGEEIEKVKKNSLFSYGDESNLIELQSKNVPIGNIFSMRKGTKIYTFFVLGVHLSDKEICEEILKNKLDLFINYNPKQHKKLELKDKHLKGVMN